MVSRSRSAMSQWYRSRNTGIMVDPSGLNYSAEGRPEEIEKYTGNAEHASKEDKLKRIIRSTGNLEKTLPQQIMPVLQVLRFLGVLPLQFSNSGAARFRLVSWPMLYSLGTYGLFLLGMWFAFRARFDGSFQVTSEFSQTVSSALAIIIVSKVIVVPVTHWCDAPKVANLLSEWVNFQEQYTQRTGKSLEFGLHRRRLLTLLVAITVLQIIQQFVSTLFSRDFHLEPLLYRDLTVYCLMTTLRSFVITLWAIMCRSTRIAATTMLQHLKQDMEKCSRPPDTISNYMGLWLELSRLAAYIGTAFSKVYSHLIVCFVATLTIYLHNIISIQMSGKYGKLLWLFTETGYTTAVLFIICDGATGVYQQVGDSFRRYLLSLRVDSRHLVCHTEIEAFLRIMDAEPPVISLNGYVTINRALLTSVGSMLVTYLVVLVQFHLSS